MKLLKYEITKRLFEVISDYKPVYDAKPKQLKESDYLESLLAICENTADNIVKLTEEGKS